MPKQGTVDIVESLGRVVERYVVESPKDFIYDISVLIHAATESNEQDRTFYWLALRCGTRLVKERNVFLMDSQSRQIWLHYADSTKSVRAAYRVTVTGMDGDKIMGSICPIQYATQVKRICETALPIHTIRLAFQDGYTAELPYQGWADHRESLKEAHGGYNIYFKPASEDELAQVLRREHQIQEKEAKEQTRTKKARHSPER